MASMPDLQYTTLPTPSPHCEVTLLTCKSPLAQVHISARLSAGFAEDPNG